MIAVLSLHFSIFSIVEGNDEFYELVGSLVGRHCSVVLPAAD